MRVHSTTRSKRAHPAGNELCGALPNRVGDGKGGTGIEEAVDDALPPHHPIVIRKFGRVPPRHAWLATLLLVIVGLLSSAVLLARVLALETTPWPRTLDLCSALFSVSCDPALSDERFRILGVPIAGWGV